MAYSRYKESVCRTSSENHESPLYGRHKQSLANGKPTSQSSTYHTYDSSKAVDGCVSHNLDSNCCTHTDFLNTEAWWQVDLQQQSVIEIVGIIYRDHLLKRLAGFEIYLSNTPDWTSGVRCYQDNTASLTLVSANQNVSCQGVARYLTIYSDRRTHTYTWYSDWAFLELCEVYVTDGCLPGYSGTYCKCPANCGNQACSLGHCSNCNSGYYGPTCTTPCPSGCNANTCDKTSGFCLDCNSGYYGSTCTPCPSGCNGNRCNKTSGICTKCNGGFHGNRCDLTCPGNCNNNTCSQETGLCEVVKLNNGSNDDSRNYEELEETKVDSAINIYDTIQG
ncbi:laminin subunit gamma-1-like [Argopecten irradians]|uniref:laminin subunit gamma-1-like n=1 Tax=Argopecten irradians TaxID=31199 RepID=UPI0037238567